MNIKKCISDLFGEFAPTGAADPKATGESGKKYAPPLFEKFTLISEDVLAASLPGDPFFKGDLLGTDKNGSNADTDSGLDDDRWDW